MERTVRNQNDENSFVSDAIYNEIGETNPWHTHSNKTTCDCLNPQTWSVCSDPWHTHTNKTTHTWLSIKQYPWQIKQQTEISTSLNLQTRDCLLCSNDISCLCSHLTFPNPSLSSFVDSLTCIRNINMKHNIKQRVKQKYLNI